MRKLLLFGILGLAGCANRTVNETVLANDVTVKDVPNDRPEFKREYKVRLNANVKMTITIWQSTWLLITQGELDQPDGKWVIFEPEKPADKILDRELLPLVEKRCREILATDKAFRAAKPNSYIDDTGAVWVRKP